MSALLISACVVAVAWVAHRIVRMPVRGLRAADVEALAWEQSCEPPSSTSGSGIRVGRPTVAMPIQPIAAAFTPVN